MNLRELIRLLRTATKAEDIERKQGDIVVLLPQVEQMIGFDQKNHAHQYDLWEHSIRTVLNLPKDIPDDMVYFAALIHDIGKPDCQVKGKKPDDPNMHYYGHPIRSMEITRDEILPHLLKQGENITEDEQRRLLYYVEYHDDRVSLRLKHLRRHLRLGVSLAEFQMLMKLEIADAEAHIIIPIIQDRITVCTILSGKQGERMFESIKNGA